MARARACTGIALMMSASRKGGELSLRADCSGGNCADAGTSASWRDSRPRDGRAPAGSQELSTPAGSAPARNRQWSARNAPARSAGLQRDRQRLVDRRRVLDVRQHPHHRRDPRDYPPGGRRRHPAGGREAIGAFVAVRFVEHHVDRIARRIHREHAGERGDVEVLLEAALVAVLADLLSRAGLAAGVVAQPPRRSCRSRRSPPGASACAWSPRSTAASPARLPAAAPGGNARMVGRTSMPVATAAVPRTTCSGETEMPWPNPTVIVTISFQADAGWMIGMPASGNSMPTRPNMPIDLSQARWRSPPTVSPICAAPRLEE